MMQSFKDVIFNPWLFVILNMFFIFATFTDIKWMKIFDKFNILMLVTRIVTFFIFGFNITYLFGGIAMFVVVLLGAVITNAKIGGDIKFSGNIGLWFGFIPSAIILVISLLTNLIFRKLTRKTQAIALAPFLYAAFLITSAVTYFFF